MLGLKADPYLKMELAQECQELGMSLSEYMETILANRKMQDDVKILRYRVREEQRAKEEVLSKLEDYEQLLEELYLKYEGQELSLRKPNGKTTKTKVMSKLTLLEIIVASLNKEQ